MKENVQKVGRFLSSMVMPNMGAFIAWGLITALFIPDGWLPNEKISALVGPMVNYLLPLLIGYTGGFVVGKQRGAVVGAIATMGVIVGGQELAVILGIDSVPMFLGAMAMGPLGGFIIKKFDNLISGKTPAGFEMLINNFSSGIIGAILAIIGLLFATPFFNTITDVLKSGVEFFSNRGLLPLTAIFIEPAKVLFLNNAINHAVLSPLGIEQASTVGKSIFFMIESNPGPGLGLLLAYILFGKGNAKSSAPGAAIVHFFGGIHEIYFPYILMNPVLLVSTIAGSAAGIFVLQLFNGGIIAAASPGSIFAELLLTPKGGFIANILGILVSVAVSFVIASVLLKLFSKDVDIDEAKKKSQDLKAKSKGVEAESKAEISDTITISSDISKIVFACDAGMGSSAMGATKLRKKLRDAGITDITVEHASVSEIPAYAQIVVTHQELKERARSSHASAKIVTITNFMNAPEYDILIQDLLEAKGMLAKK